MADTPLAQLGRVLGGVALGYGSLGHQVLGQLLVFDTRQVEVAAATVLLAAFSNQKNALLQASVSVLAPAVALHVIARRSEDQLLGLRRIVDEKLAELAAQKTRRRKRRA
jgi:hypothetical protein